ncbi:MAG: hypothetical protein FJ148_16810 [Deltaproteobacteria bacterium]|nr:hypothetical protein [Deltaproteobacteria bacterium]
MIPRIALGLALLTAAPASAFTVPKSAKTLKGEFVTAHAPCTVHNVATIGPFSSVACGAPGPLPAPADGSRCFFGPKGNGKWSLTVSRSDIKVKVRMTGLDPVCEGDNLQLSLMLRITTDDSPIGDVTTVDRTEIEFGSCFVAEGRCDISTTFETFFGSPDILKDDRLYSIEVLRVDLWNHFGAVSLRNFTSGLRVGPN